MQAGWIALSDKAFPGMLPCSDAAAGGADGVLAAGTLVMEVEGPLGPGTVLLDHQASGGWPRGFSVFADPGAGLVLMHRQGARLARHGLAGPPDFRGGGAARIVFSWDGPGRIWSLSLEIAGQAGHAVQRGTDPIPLPLSDIMALCGDGATRHPCLRWLGVRQGFAAPAAGAWIGAATLLDTPQGPRRADALRAGDSVLTAAGEVRQIRALRRRDLPGRGGPAPVRLRAPYFARSGDILVSPDQMVQISGAEVEYLFGAEHALVEAAHLVEGRAALREPGRAATGGLSLDLGAPALMVSAGCALLSPAADGSPACAVPHRVLQEFEVQPLLALLGRGGGRSAA